MANIKYVCFSDMHFGAQNSLLTNLSRDGKTTDFSSPSLVAKALIDCLYPIFSSNEKGVKPSMILMGDILELALCQTHEALMTFHRFVEVALPENEAPFDDVFFIPGNHDHHLWELAREIQYTNYLKRTEIKNNYPVMWHVTNIFVEDDPNPIHELLMDSVLKKHLPSKERHVRVVYPNFGILNKSKDKAIIFHHGHFTEEIYLLMSKANTFIFPEAKMPVKIWEIEKENFAWIDFFWSTMGRSGRVGENVEVIYDKMTDEKKFQELLKNLSTSIAKKIRDGEDKNASLIKKFFKKIIKNISVNRLARVIHPFLNFTLGRLAKQERKSGGGSYSEEIRENLIQYIDTSLRMHIESEKKDNPPKKIEFIFGHTHKPFAENWNTKSYGTVPVYNTGGWVIDNQKRDPSVGGAVILVDEDGNVCSLELFRETGIEGRATNARVLGDRNPLYDKISAIIQNNSEIFKNIADVVESEIKIRHLNLQYKINS